MLSLLSTCRLAVTVLATAAIFSPALARAEAPAALTCDGLFIFTTFKPAAVEPRAPKSRAYHLESSDAQSTYERIFAKVRNLPPSGNPLLSIVMPAYKEALRLPRSLEILREFMDRYQLDYEVIVVVERSPDESFAVAMEAAKGDSRIRIVQNLDGRGMPLQGGKGFAVRTGMQRATGRYRLFMDSDLSTRLVETLYFLDRMLPKEPGDPTVRPQMLIGSREEAAGSDVRARTMMRELMSSTMRKLTYYLGRPPEVVDTQCGFKMFTGDAADLLFSLQRENGFAFDVELLLLAAKFQYAIEAQPVEWIDAPGSTVDPIKDSIKMLRAMLRIRGATKDTDRAIRRDP